MNVTELFRRLSYGELSNIALGSVGAGSIKEEDRPRVISYVNDGLLDLYSRFVLKENDLILQLSDFITNYHFLKRFAVSNTDPTDGDTLYIQDHTGDPFTEDLIKVLQVTDAVGCQLKLNDADDPCSFFTPQPNVLQVPRPVQDQIVGVVYQAKHDTIAYDDMDACIEVPLVLEPALRAYIASKVYQHMNGQENSAKAAEYLTLYEAKCTGVVEMDLVNSSISNSFGRKFEDRGFV